MTDLKNWENFNVIVGSSAGALIGLQFVLLSLLAARPLQQMGDAGSAFGTPTVVHFSVVLFLAAIASAPWDESAGLSVVWGLTSLTGLMYSMRVVHKMKLQTAYRPVLEDWIFHAALPLGAYILIAVAACIAQSSERSALFSVGAAMLLLLFTGVHNSWDAVTYSVFKHDEERRNLP